MPQAEILARRKVHADYTRSDELDGVKEDGAKKVKNKKFKVGSTPNGGLSPMHRLVRIARVPAFS